MRTSSGTTSWRRAPPPADREHPFGGVERQEPAMSFRARHRGRAAARAGRRGRPCPHGEAQLRSSPPCITGAGKPSVPISSCGSAWLRRRRRHLVSRRTPPRPAHEARPGCTPRPAWKSPRIVPGEVRAAAAGFRVARRKHRGARACPWHRRASTPSFARGVGSPSPARAIGSASMSARSTTPRRSHGRPSAAPLDAGQHPACGYARCFDASGRLCRRDEGGGVRARRTSVRVALQVGGSNSTGCHGAFRAVKNTVRAFS